MCVCVCVCVCSERVREALAGGEVRVEDDYLSLQFSEIKGDGMNGVCVSEPLIRPMTNTHIHTHMHTHILTCGSFSLVVGSHRLSFVLASLSS
jgi:hypothetical protein